MRIAVVGSGYVGLVAGACFAELGHNVLLVDNDERKLAELQDMLAELERGLAEMEVAGEGDAEADE
jgi:UDP-glucose 6-dehydrogenase